MNDKGEKMKKEIEVKFDDLEWLYSQNWEYFDYGNCKRHLQVIMPYREKDLKRNILLFFMFQELHGTSRNCIMIFRNWRSWRNRELLLCQLRFVSLILQFFRRR